jgi:HD-like signal output (HDOD) protein
MPVTSPPPSSAPRAAACDPILDAVLDLIARDAVKVPPIPSVVARLSEVLADPGFELHQVAGVVGTDQALAAHILRCASSTLLAARGQVTTLNEAVMRVGANGLFSLAVSFTMGRETARSTPLQGLRRDVFRTAAASAEFSRRLASRFGADPERAFLCGLLASFGRTVALGAIEQAIAASKAREPRPAAAWMEMARRCEEQMGPRVAAQWGMPQIVSDVLAARHSPLADAVLLPLVRTLDVSEQLTQLFYSDATPAAEEIAQVVGCDVEAAAEIARSLPEVAATVCALGAAADDLKLTQSIQIPVVELPPTTLKGQVVSTTIPVTVERKSGDQHLVCVGLAADGFVARGTQSLPLNQVVKCRLLGIEENLDLFAFVAAVVKEDGYRFEIKPMGLTGPTARRWQELRSGSAGAEAGAMPAGGEAEPARLTGSIRVGGLAGPSSGQSGGVSLHGDRSPLRRLGSWFRGRGAHTGD